MKGFTLEPSAPIPCFLLIHASHENGRILLNLLMATMPMTEINRTVFRFLYRLGYCFIFKRQPIELIKQFLNFFYFFICADMACMAYKLLTLLLGFQPLALSNSFFPANRTQLYEHTDKTYMLFAFLSAHGSCEMLIAFPLPVYFGIISLMGGRQVWPASH